MRAKFFSADSLEAAEAMAETHFGRGKNELTVEVISGSEGTPGWQIFVFSGSPRELAEMSGDYKLFYEGDGVYLEMYSERGTGSQLDPNAMSSYLFRKKINGLDEAAMRALMARRHGRTRIGPPQQEFLIGEDLTVETNREETEAWATLLAPEPGGAALEFEEAKRKIAAAGVIHGLDEDLLRELLTVKDYHEPRTIAKATHPEHGEDGRLVFHFHRDPKTGQPKELEGGKVDLKTLDLFEPVTEGQLLVSRLPATPGKPGTSVKGNEIKHRQGKEVALPKSKNTIVNDDRTEMHAKCSGMVDYVNGMVNVSSVYVVKGDVGSSVGNIDFDGSVQVTGNVLANHVIKASGGVSVGGVVEASTIIAGGNVEIKGGMQGGNKGKIEAGGSVSIMFIEWGTVIAGSTITVDASVNSLLEAGDTVIAKGRRGGIMGGRTCAGKEIIANVVGSVAHSQTEIEVGVMPRKRARLQFLEKEIERLRGELVKLGQLDTYLRNAQGKLDAATYDKLYRSGEENKRIYREQMDDNAAEIRNLKHEMEHAEDGKVHVFDTVYPDVRIIIASDMFKVNEEIQYATFKYRDGAIVYGTCERKKG